AFCFQLVVRAELEQTRALEHDDEVGHADGRESMRHEDGHVASVTVSPCGGGKTLKQRVFSLSIERCRGLVQHQDQWSVAHESARESEFLPLAERDLDTAGPGRA